MSFRKIVLPALFAVMAAVPAGAEDRHIPSISCRRAPGTPVIDGYMSDEAWRYGEPLLEFHQLGREGRSAELPNMAVMVYDEENLYIAMVMGKRPGFVMADSMWRDGVEIFIDPGRAGKGYFQVAGNHKGAWSAAHPPDGAADISWDPGKEMSARVLTAGWLLEVAIPFESVGGAPAEGDVWGINLCRNDAHARFITLAPLRSGFHELEGFPEVTFAGKLGEPVRMSGRGGREKFERLMARLSRMVSQLPAESFARGPLEDSLQSLQETALEIENEMAKHPVIARVYGEWAYGFLLEELQDNIYWRVMTARMFERKSR